MRCCEKCGQKIKTKLHCYSSGSGSLTLTWVEDTPNMIAVSRKVTKRDCLRYLANHLTAKGWVPVFVEQRWQLAERVKRTGPNRLKAGDGSSYTYDWNKSECPQAAVFNTVFYFTMRVKGKNQRFELKNHSILMVLRYFLNHEKELTPQFKAAQ